MELARRWAKLETSAWSLRRHRHESAPASPLGQLPSYRGVSSLCDQSEQLYSHATGPAINYGPERLSVGETCNAHPTTGVAKLGLS